MPRSSISASVGAGSGSASSLSSSSAIRSRLSAMRSLARAAQAASAAGSGLAFAEARVEAEEAQDAQMVLGDALERLADEGDAARGDIGLAADMVDHLAGQRIGVERVDGEVAPRGVGGPVVGEDDGGAAAVGVEVAAQGGDFDDGARGDRGDGAVGDPGRHGLDPRGLEPADDLLRGEGGGEIEIVGGDPEQGIAHRAADEARPAVLGVERVKQARDAGPVEPVTRIDLHRARRDRLTSIAAVAPQMRRSSQMISK